MAPTQNDTGAMEWTLIHQVAFPRTEPETMRYLNFSVTDPGYYKYYQWYFDASVGGNNDGPQLRQILLNPSGYATHFGEPWAKALQPVESFDGGSEVAPGLTNVAFGKTAFQSTTNNNGAASKAINGGVSSQRWGSSCSLTFHQPKQWWVVDLGFPHEVCVWMVGACA